MASAESSGNLFPHMENMDNYARKVPTHGAWHVSASDESNACVNLLRPASEGGTPSLPVLHSKGQVTS